MLDDRERHALARIERELATSDPDFVRKFSLGATPRTSGPAVLLTVGLAVMVLGAAMVSVAIAMTGIVVACAALVAASRRPIGFRTA